MRDDFLLSVSSKCMLVLGFLHAQGEIFLFHFVVEDNSAVIFIVWPVF